MDFAQFDASMGGQSAAPTQSAPLTYDSLNAAMTAPPPAQPLIDTTGIRPMLEGIMQGLGDVTDYPAQLIARGMDASGLTGLMNRHGGKAPTAAELKQAQQNALTQYEAQYGHSKSAGIGRFIGNAAAFAPALETGGATLAMGADGAAGMLPEGLGNLVRGGVKLASGEAGSTATLPGLIGRGASLATRGALTGAGANALVSGVNGPTEQDLSQGAKIGALAGVAAPVVGKLVGSAYDHTIGNWASTPAKALNGAVDTLKNALIRDGLTPAQAVNKLQALGPQGVLADLGGNVGRVADSVATTPGVGAATAERVLEGRAASQGDRIMSATQQATGADGDFHDMIDNLTQQQRAKAGPLYAKSNAVAPLSSPILSQLAAQPEIQNGIKSAMDSERMMNAGKPGFNPADYDKKAIDFSAPLQMRHLDLAKQGLDEQIEGHRNELTGVLDQSNPKVRGLNAMKNDLLSETDKLNPDYAAARNAFAGPAVVKSAAIRGKNIFLPGQEASTTAKVVANMSPSEKQGFLGGVTEAIRNKVGNTVDGASAVNKIFGTGNLRDKVAAAFDNPEAFEQFRQSMENESTFANTRNALLKGSKTARVLGAQQEFDATPHLLNAARGNIFSAAHGVTMDAINALTRPTEARSAALGNLLFERSPQELHGLLQDATPTTGQRIRGALANRLTGAVVPGAALLGQPNR